MRHARPQLNNGLPPLECRDHGHKVATRPGATSAPRIYSRAITCSTSPLGASCTQRTVPTGEVSEDASGSVALSSFGFCTVIRGAFCIVPVQASSIVGQVPLAYACHSLVRLPCCSRSWCVYHAARARALIHSQLRTRLYALELSLSRLLTRPLASLSTSLSSSPLLSLLLSTHAHA